MILLFEDDFTTGASASGLYSRTSTSGHSWVAESVDQGGAIVNVFPVIGLNSSGYYFGSQYGDYYTIEGRYIDAEVPSVMADTTKPIKIEFDIFNDGRQIYDSSWYVPFAVRVAMGFEGSPMFAYAISFQTFDVVVALTDSTYITQLGSSDARTFRTAVTVEWDGLSGLSLKLNGTAITTETYTPDAPFITPKITAAYDQMSGIVMENFKMYGTIYEATAPTFWKDKIKCREVT